MTPEHAATLLANDLRATALARRDVAPYVSEDDCDTLASIAARLDALAEDADHADRDLLEDYVSARLREASRRPDGPDGLHEALLHAIGSLFWPQTPSDFIRTFIVAAEAVATDPRWQDPDCSMHMFLREFTSAGRA